MLTTIRDRSRGRIAWDALVVVLIVVNAGSSEKTEKMTPLLLEGVIL